MGKSCTIWKGMHSKAEKNVLGGTCTWRAKGVITGKASSRVLTSQAGFPAESWFANFVYFSFCTAQQNRT